MLIIFFMVFAYLLGSISSSILICQWMKLPDPRKEGSHNPGGTNVYRVGGKKAAVLTLLCDMLKGFLPVFLASLVNLNIIHLTLIAFAAFLGHLFPLFFNFKGGKGVATALGSLFALSGSLSVSALLTWLFIAVCFRYSSLASLLTFAVIPFYAWYFIKIPQVVLILSLISLLVIFRHKKNIQHLINGTEQKIRRKD